MRKLPLLGILLAAAAVQAQTPSPLQFRVQHGNTTQTLSDGGTFAVQAEAFGLASPVSINVANRGTTAITVQTIDQTGSLDFQITSQPEFPLTLNPNQSFNIGMRFLPRLSARQTARIGVVFTSGTATQNNGITLVGTSPETAFSFIPQGGNATVLQPNGTITFGTTAIDATTNTAVVLINRGTAPATFRSVALRGDAAFQLVGAPLADTQIEGGRELRFQIAFTPKQLEPVSAVLDVELLGSRQSFNVQGSGSGAAYTYDLIRESGAAPVPASGIIAVPDVAVNEKSSVTVRVRNNGNAEARITQINVQGTGYTLTDVPFLPLVLQQGQTATVTVTFAPTQAGRASGRLRIGNDTFELTSQGLGSIVNYSYAVGPVTTSVASGGTVILTPAAVGRTSTLRFQINNTGTSPAPISSISITGGNNVFALAGLPALPVEVPVNGTVGFDVSFSPNALNTATATLRVDSQSFTLSGSGTNPAPIPDFRIDGAAATQEPLQQPAVGVSIASPYTLRLNGTLTLALNSGAFSNDPSVQFATGGRTVSFFIPAGQTRAVFPDGSNQIRLQTGTVAGTIALTPSFVTEGGVDLTPTSPAPTNLVIAQSAPRVLGASITNRTAAGFTLQVTGLATSRSVNQLDVTFTPISGENVQTTRLSLNVAPSFLAWYQNAASQPFGSLFTLTVPFTMTGDVRGQNLALVDTIQSLSFTLTNGQGASPARSLDLK